MVTAEQQRAIRVSVLAFRCAWAQGETREQASAKALKAYQGVLPEDRDAADKVVEAIVDAVRLRPHWVDA